MSNKLVSKLTKKEILKLPGFEDKGNLTVKELRKQIDKNVKDMKLRSYGLRVNTYKNGFKQKDKELFRNVARKKKENKNVKAKQQNYENEIKERALEERDINNISIDLYNTAKTEARREYKERIKQVNNKKDFKKYMKQYNIKANKKETFEVQIGDDEDKRLAFTEMLRNIYKTCKDKIVIKATNLDGTSKWFTLSKNQEIEKTIGHLAGTIDLQTDSSDINPWVSDMFIPVKYEVRFLKKNTYDKGEGGFFPYINLSDIDLTPFQIFNTIDKNNYRDNCFVYALIQSGVFSEEEIEHLRYMVQTRTIPNDKIKQISQAFSCHFVINKIYEDKEIRRQMKLAVDTRNKPWAINFKRTVNLILYKNHYMFYDGVPVSTYYIKHYKELNEKYPNNERKMLINSISNGFPKYQKGKTKLMKVLRNMLKYGLLKEIESNDIFLLSTCEYNNQLNDYTNLEYDLKLCCKPIKNDEKQIKWSQIYYSDFETDVTGDVHKPYLNVTVYKEKNQLKQKIFTGDNISERLLDFLNHNSLTWFHNLRYDSCFFINISGWDVSITERNGTVLQIIMTKDKKRLTFKNSYSIIPAPLRSFANMFNLPVHKEIMAYKLYTERNIKRKVVSALEYQLQYYNENRDKPLKEIKKDWRCLIDNAIKSDSYEDGKINIMKYAIYYCTLDCIVLIKGMHKFEHDLMDIFNDIGVKMPSINNYLSISAIGYDFTKRYGCFDGCMELSGKPQNFILRCVNGGRCMVANNEKQYIKGKIQDFDAVSLYPSAMKIMDGVPKGIPKIIDNEDLLSYDTFFAEINIKNISCKNNVPYRFGQIYHKNNEDSKIYDNNPTDNFYIDKVAFKDLLEFYDFEYEIVRGYYFDEGFNNKINELIETLFQLRLKYKRENNPLQNTIKLLLNSIYGKSILKAMTKETKCINKEKIYQYIWRNYNYITEVVDEPCIDNVFVKRIKPINNHFNLPQFGASVLSWSKHLMNRVMGCAEQNGIPIFYQDTDSMHLFEDDVSRLATIYKKRYGKELIGTKMTQFHNDFDSFKGSVGNIYSRKFIGLGKKSYLDILVDEVGNEGYHMRMRGVPKQCIINYCKKNNISIEELYEKLYKGEEVTFDLLDGSNGFKKTKSFQQINLQTFNRTVKF